MDSVKFRLRYWHDENRRASKLGVNSLPLDTIKERSNKHNENNYKSERWFINLLNNRFNNDKYNFKIHRNYCILNRYFADFFIIELDLAIEIDGTSHDNYKSKLYDNKRDNLFYKRGITVFRIKAYDELAANIVMREIEKSLDKLYYNINRQKIKEEAINKKRSNKIKRKIKASEYREMMNNKQMLWALGKGPSPFAK